MCCSLCCVVWSNGVFLCLGMEDKRSIVVFDGSACMLRTCKFAMASQVNQPAHVNHGLGGT